MYGGPSALSGLRTEVRDFMRCCEALLSRVDRDALTEDEREIVRHYIQWLTEQCGP